MTDTPTKALAYFFATLGPDGVINPEGKDKSTGEPHWHKQAERSERAIRYLRQNGYELRQTT